MKNKETTEKILNERSVEKTPHYIALVARLENLVDEAIKKERERVEFLIAAEISICHQEGTPTSRLTSLFNKLSTKQK